VSAGAASGFLRVRADTPLKRLPRELDPKQALFLDGIRHATELAEMAYARLVDRLTDLALAGKSDDNPLALTEPYLYAWAVVDSVDRLRGLLRLMPGLAEGPDAGPWGQLRAETEVIRDLRNVSDHLAQRVDYVHLFRPDRAARDASVIFRVRRARVRDRRTR
jgi:hypothetical protein